MVERRSEKRHHATELSADNRPCDDKNGGSKNSVANLLHDFILIYLYEFRLRPPIPTKNRRQKKRLMVERRSEKRHHATELPADNRPCDDKNGGSKNSVANLLHDFILICDFIMLHI
ncbi:hypothetical protein TorRG33x02_230860 [Trema orientale]|uniref:Uncharacterized protein n=1 Tax=Trema orientale TaxID=63057 RepID=A0A2P5E6E8_TREOI|nr:hypothetical protein TorRG33x02_230860 [Trema orientale]